MTVIRGAQARRTQTPNAVMTTLASPTQGGSSHVVWRVDMTPGQAGPRHGIDAEQVWTVLAGAATVEMGDETVTVAPGDTVVLPADLPRRITSDAAAGFAALVVAPVGMQAYLVPDGDKLVPAWVV
jgi:quercetin dioxygenase-like cupin family protein